MDSVGCFHQEVNTNKIFEPPGVRHLLCRSHGFGVPTEYASIENKSLRECHLFFIRRTHLSKTTRLDRRHFPCLLGTRGLPPPPTRPLHNPVLPSSEIRSVPAQEVCYTSGDTALTEELSPGHLLSLENIVVSTVCGYQICR